ncbi:16534_t:CDS:2, partial [Dentiscutata erythropus]
RKKVKDFSGTGGLRNLLLPKPTIIIDSQNACDLDRDLTLQELFYWPEGLYQNVDGLWDACKKADYKFLFNNIKKWLDGQAMYQIFRFLPKNIPYASYSKITNPNSVHQCDLIEISYDEDVDTGLLDNGPIFYYVLLVIDCATRYKDFIFLISKSSEEVVEAFKSIYNNPDNPLNWAQLLIKARFRHTSLAMVDHYAELFELRVFKNEYAIEFLLSTGERCKECEQFARRIVNNMNDTPTQLIGMSPNNTTKLEQEEPMLPSRWILRDNRIITPSFPNHDKFVHLDLFALAGEKKARFDNADYHYIRRPSLAPHYTHLDVILLRI